MLHDADHKKAAQALDFSAWSRVRPINGGEASACAFGRPAKRNRAQGGEGKVAAVPFKGSTCGCCKATGGGPLWLRHRHPQ